MSQNGVPKEKILAGARGRMIVNGKLTDIAKWSLKNAPSEAVGLISPFDVQKVAEGADIKLLVNSGYSKQSIAKYASEEALGKAGIRTTSEGNGKRVVHFNETESISARTFGQPQVSGKASASPTKEETRIPTVVDPVCIEKTLQRLAR